MAERTGVCPFPCSSRGTLYPILQLVHKCTRASAPLLCPRLNTTGGFSSPLEPHQTPQSPWSSLSMSPRSSQIFPPPSGPSALAQTLSDPPSRHTLPWLTPWLQELLHLPAWLLAPQAGWATCTSPSRRPKGEVLRHLPRRHCWPPHPPAAFPALTVPRSTRHNPHRASLPSLPPRPGLQQRESRPAVPGSLRPPRR